MGSFDVRQGGINSGPNGYRVSDGVWIDGPGFSLCAAPLELLGPEFQDGRGDGMNECRSGVYWTGVGGGGYSKGRSCVDDIKWQVVIMGQDLGG